MNIELFRDKIIAVENQIYEVKGLQKGTYDAQAIQYDKLISNALYNRIMWGNLPKDYTIFCKKGLKSNEGVIADIGCGTLSFTHKVYAEHNDSKLFLCDLSLEMLKIGQNKLESTNKDISNITFLRSDALHMPFKDNTVQTVLSFGIFHIFENPTQLIQEAHRMLKNNGELFLSSLCTDRKLSKKYLGLLHKKGHVAKPLSAAEITAIVVENGFSIREKVIKGGMLYLSSRKK